MTAVFVAAVLVALVAGGLAVATRREDVALATLAIALAIVMLGYQQPGLAIIELAAIGGAAMVLRVARGEPAVEQVPRVGRVRAVAIAAVVGALSFVLVGTWARQFVWAGRELAAGVGFGELPGVAWALAGAPGLLAVGLVIVVAAAACAGPPRHRI
jgi:hypothetical protein